MKDIPEFTEPKIVTRKTYDCITDREWVGAGHRWVGDQKEYPSLVIWLQNGWIMPLML